CIYCYARVTHEYLGYSAGLDFESKIMVKMNVVELLKKAFQTKGYQPLPIMLSGNTDCYQPIEREYKLTRGMLELLLSHRHPVSIITKNALILRDIDILKELSRLDLVHVNMSITSLNEDLRMLMEPRTATYKRRVEVVRTLSNAGIPVNVMIAPIVPSVNDHEIPSVMKAVSDAGALSAAYTFVRLNGTIGEIFEDWVFKAFPDRAEKVLNQVREAHGGNLYDHRPGVRMSGEGKIAESIRNLFMLSRKRYFKDKVYPSLDISKFIAYPERGQLSMF
ncbi:MAG TPA: PA0069 family radical SAM protein, partial [Cytophagales bacterium]|nr:PA0069 family radical SAM protein [Cytophagales bacterium]